MVGSRIDYPDLATEAARMVMLELVRIGRANIEANLIYLDRTESDIDESHLEDRLPVRWEADRAVKVTWSDAPRALSEDSEADAFLVPPIFLWATFHPVSAMLRVRLDHHLSLPKMWSLRLHHSNSLVLASEEQYPTAPADGELVIPLPTELLGFPVTTLRVLWSDGETSGEAPLPVQVNDRKSLPPPAALQSLTVDGILACILSGCNPAQWVDRKLNQMGSGVSKPSIDPGVDPHRFHDPSGLALYRIRRLGRGLAAMGQRLAKTVRTPEAVEYQVHRHPLGPVRLADALVREAQTTASSTSKMDRARISFGLLEIALMMAHAGKRLHRQKQSGEADHRPCFRRAVANILLQTEEHAYGDDPDSAGATGLGDSLGRYRAAVHQKSVELLSGLHCEEETICQ